MYFKEWLKTLNFTRWKLEQVLQLYECEGAFKIEAYVLI